MAQTLVYGVVFLLLAQMLETAMALQCYECSGLKGTNHPCELNLSLVNIQNCTTGFVCARIVSTSENRTTIHRLCSETNECEVVNAKNSHTLGNVTVDSCTTCPSDYCNSAQSYLFSFNVVALFLSSISVLFANKFVY